MDAPSAIQGSGTGQNVQEHFRNKRRWSFLSSHTRLFAPIPDRVEEPFMFYQSFFDPDDRWPAYAVGPVKHLHALGVLALNFSFYEGAMVIPFEEYIPKPLAKYLFDMLNNQERLNTIRELVGTFERDPVMIDHIDHLLMHFSECIKNRHMLMHARTKMPPLDGFLHLEKEANRDPNRLLTFKLSLEDLRQAADDMMQGADYLLSIWRYRATKEQLSGGRKYFSGVPTLVLPEKPPRPRIVNPLQPPSEYEEPPGQIGLTVTQPTAESKA
jgi:hypothetical protein